MTKKETSATPVDAILDAAALLFRDKGFAATSVRDLAEAAGILPGSLHYRFRTKEDVLAALMERAIDRLIAAILAAVATENDALERLRRAIRAHLELVLSGADGVYVLLYDWRSLSPTAARALARQRSRYEAFADQLVAQAAAVAPLRRDVDLVLLRRFGFGAVNWVAQWFDPKDGYSIDEIADHFWRYMTAGALDVPITRAHSRKEGSHERPRRSA